MLRFGDAPLVQTWGRPETEGVRFFVNSGFELSGSSELYARFSLAETDGRYRFFYRHPDALRALSATVSTCDRIGTPDRAFRQRLREQGFGLPGFTPFLDGDQDDASITLGITGEFDSGMTYDFSYTYGKKRARLLPQQHGQSSHSGLADLQTLPQMDFTSAATRRKKTRSTRTSRLQWPTTSTLHSASRPVKRTFTAFAGRTELLLRGGVQWFPRYRARECGRLRPRQRRHLRRYRARHHRSVPDSVRCALRELLGLRQYAERQGRRTLPCQRCVRHSRRCFDRLSMHRHPVSPTSARSSRPSTA